MTIGGILSELTSQATILRAFEAVSPEKSRPSAKIVPLRASHERSRYGGQRRPDIRATAGAAGVVGLLLSGLLTLDVVSVQPPASKLTVVKMVRASEPPAPPPPPSPPQQAALVKPASPAPIVTAPPPMITLAAPLQTVTSPEPAPPEPFVPRQPAPAAPAPAMASAGNLASTVISAPPPQYPYESRRKREQGTVVLTVLLALDGTVADISVLHSSGSERLDRAALAAVRRWRWHPTRHDGAPVMVRGLVEIPFVLQKR